jgi:hypothetical protein
MSIVGVTNRIGSGSVVLNPTRASRDVPIGVESTQASAKQPQARANRRPHFDDSKVTKAGSERLRFSARKIRRVVGIAFAAIDLNRRMGAERPLHRDAFRRVVVSELCRDDGAGCAALLDPGDRRGDQG